MGKIQYDQLEFQILVFGVYQKISKLYKQVCNSDCVQSRIRPVLDAELFVSQT